MRVEQEIVRLNPQQKSGYYPYALVFEQCEQDALDFLQTHPEVVLQSVQKNFADQLLEGLKFLHSLDLTHRDIKVENLLITRDERGTYGVKLGDFGLTTHKSESDFTGQRGSRGYMISSKNYQKLGEEAPIVGDFYAAGVTICAIYTGNMLFGDERIPNARYDVLQRDKFDQFFKTIQKNDIFVSKECEEYLRRCFQKIEQLDPVESVDYTVIVESESRTKRFKKARAESALVSLLRFCDGR